MNMSLKRKKTFFFTLGMFLLLSISLMKLEVSIGKQDRLIFIFGFAYLPLILLLYEGMLSQKAFAFFMQSILTIIQNLFAEKFISSFFPIGSDKFYLYFLVLTLTIYTLYIILMWHFGRQILKKIFSYGNSSEWLLYSISAMLSYFVILIIQNNTVSENTYFYYLVLIYILWSVSILCFAIINSNEKSKQKYEAEFAQSIISSGHEHYKKMNEMFEALHITRHDYQYHLNVIHELVHNNDMDQIDAYLSDMQLQLHEQEPLFFCDNSILNALIASYARRCSQSNIEFTVKLALPDNLSISNYDLCIIIGNLLENAVEASLKLTQECHIQLEIKQQGNQLAIMSKNNFNGFVNIDHEQQQILSTKTNGGLGVKSIQAVVSRQGGDTYIDWDETTFTAYVLINL